jgi:hypothetical protein
MKDVSMGWGKKEIRIEIWMVNVLENINLNYQE